MYRREHHVASALHLAFADFGILCSPELLSATSDLILLLTPLINSDTHFGQGKGLPEGIQALLGFEPLQRIYNHCRTVLEHPPSGSFFNAVDAFKNLEAVFMSLVSGKIACTCAASPCDTAKAWRGIWKPSKEKCKLRILWNNLGHAVAHALSCLLVVSAGEGAIQYDRNVTPGYGRDRLERTW